MEILEQEEHRMVVQTPFGKVTIVVGMGATSVICNVPSEGFDTWASQYEYEPTRVHVTMIKKENLHDRP